MKKITMLSLAMLLVAATAFAQDSKMSIGLGLGVGLPMGDFSKDTKGNAAMGFGGGLTFGYMVNSNIEVGLGVGYQTFGENKSVPGDNKTTNIPILLNGRYIFAGDKLKPYVGVGLGMTNQTFDTGSNDGSAMVFTWGLGVGALYGMSEKMDLDFGLSYNNVNSDGAKYDFGGGIGKVESTINTPYLGIKVGINYKL
ncbi:porin family protein [bacterium]|nr:porin family protein [bacterium]